MTFEDASPADFDAIFAIYSAVMELSEQKTPAELRALFDRDDYRILTARIDGAIAGVSFAWAPADENIFLLEYLAVDATRQNAGIGSRLYQATRETVGPERIGLIETDIATIPGSIQQRRLGLYARLGCRRIGSIRYQLPLDHYGAPPPMLLLAHTPPDVASLPRETVRTWLARMYVEVYGQRADDPRIAEMLAAEPADLLLTAP
jgi:GNAT superfamily N-acetyltransferase